MTSITLRNDQRNSQKFLFTSQRPWIRFSYQLEIVFPPNYEVFLDIFQKIVIGNKSTAVRALVGWRKVRISLCKERYFSLFLLSRRGLKNIFRQHSSYTTEQTILKEILVVESVIEGFLRFSKNFLIFLGESASFHVSVSLKKDRRSPL